MTFGVAEGIALAGLLASAAGTAYTVNEQQNTAKRNQQASDEAAARSAAARRDERVRQEALQRERQGVVDETLQAVSGDGAREAQAQAEEERLATAARVASATPEAAGAQIYTSTGAGENIRNIMTAEVSRRISDAREDLASRARLAAYSDVASAEARRRSAAQSALEALGSMGRGSLSVAQIEGGIPAGLSTPNTALGQGLVVGGNLATSTANRTGSWITGTPTGSDQLAAAIQATNARPTVPQSGSTGG
jgi:hypothetical protein